MANTLAEKYGVQDYLKIENFDENVKEDLKDNLIENINKKINENYNKHIAIKHYKDIYNFIPPFALTKILTFGVINRYYGLLKQSDRQDISYLRLEHKNKKTSYQVIGIYLGIVLLCILFIMYSYYGAKGTSRTILR